MRNSTRPVLAQYAEPPALGPDRSAMVLNPVTGLTHLPGTETPLIDQITCTLAQQRYHFETTMTEAKGDAPDPDLSPSLIERLFDSTWTFAESDEVDPDLVGRNTPAAYFSTLITRNSEDESDPDL